MELYLEYDPNQLACVNETCLWQGVFIPGPAALQAGKTVQVSQLGPGRIFISVTSIPATPTPSGVLVSLPFRLLQAPANMTIDIEDSRVTPGQLFVNGTYVANDLCNGDDDCDENDETATYGLGRPNAPLEIRIQ